MKRCCLFILMLTLCGTVWSQSVKITGVVRGATDKQPLPGVNVFVKGTPTGTVTTAEGTFTIDAKVRDILVFSFVGMKSQEVEVKGQASLVILMDSDTRKMEEVVVVGYGTQTKREITGSVVGIKSNELVGVANSSAIQALQSKVAGVQVVTSGAPGSLPTIRVRGIGTLLGGADPLYVVDGVIGVDPRSINSSDVVAIDVLKDASSQAIYGARAANGVILVTTKKGTGKATFTYDGFYGFKNIARSVKMANSAQYVAYNNDAHILGGGDPNNLPFTNADIKNNTNWLKEITRDMAKTEQHAVGLSGSGENNRYYLSAGYFKEQGLLLGSDYQKATARLTNDYNPFKGLTLSSNVNFIADNSNSKPFSSFTEAYRQAPNIVPYENDKYGYTLKNNVANPLASVNYTNSKTKGYNVNAVFSAKYRFLDHFTVESSFGGIIGTWESKNYTPKFYVSPNQKNDISSLSIGKTEHYRWTWDNIIRYEQIFNGIHDVKVMVGTTAERISEDGLSGYRKNIPEKENYWYFSLGDVNSMSNGSNVSLETRNSYIGRISYGYNQKYMVNATMRYDGSSNFPTYNRWSFFPSVGAAWIASKESFIESLHLFDMLKVKGSWGRVGNDRIPASSFIYTVAESAGYPFGPNQEVQNGGTINQLKDLDLKWEITQEANLGVDFGMLSNRLTGSVEYYHKKTSDALIFKSVEINGVVDDDQTYLTNAATIVNKGFEARLGWEDKVGGIGYSISGNITFNNNNVTKTKNALPLNDGSLGNGEYTTRTVEGRPIGSFFVYQADGTFKSQAEVDAYPHIQGAKPGDLKLLDTNGDKVIDEKDRVFAGSYNPKYFYGLDLGLTYSGFDVNVNFYGVGGNKIYNGKKAQRWANENVEEQVFNNRWTPANSTSDAPRASNDVPKPSTYYLEKGDFLRVNNITLGYTLPESWFKGKITNLRIYATAQNPFTFQKFTGYNPELPGGTLNSGIELNAYPALRTFLLGVNLKF